MYEIHHKDCLEHMHTMPVQSVDAILTDLPYGTTACAWDVVIPFEPMWEAVKHVLKPDCVFVTTANQPFSSLLVCSNLPFFKYEWIWQKSKSGSAFTAKFRPVNKHEHVLVFGHSATKYNAILTKGKAYSRNHYIAECDINHHGIGFNRKHVKTENNGFRYPITVQFFQQKWRRQDQLHPTQKPVALYKYLVQTYTNPGDTVLDVCMGSGTTGEACIELCRDFIGCEKEEEHFQTARRRLEKVSRQGQLFSVASSANKALLRTQARSSQLSLN